MSNIVPASSASLVPAGPANFFEAYGETVNTNRIVGDLLKFNKGDWLVGKDGNELPKGTRLIANVADLKVGWQRWEGNRPSDTRMGRVAEGFRPPSRTELGDLDQELWERDNENKPRDPWQATNVLILKATDSDALYTFAPSSKTAISAIGKVTGEFGKRYRQRPNDLPIVELGVDSFIHKDPRVGRVKIPVLKIVGWTSNDAFVEALEAEAAEAEANAESDAFLNDDFADEAPAPSAGRGRKAATSKTEF